MLAVKMKNAKTVKPLVPRSFATQTTVQLQIYTRSYHSHEYEVQGYLDIEMDQSLNQLRDQVETKWVRNLKR